MFFRLMLIFQILQLGCCNTEVGPIRNVICKYIDTCPDEPVSSGIACKITVKEIDNDGNKSYFCNFTTAILLDKTITSEVEIYKWGSAGWRLLSIHRYNFCDHVSKYFSKMWHKLLKSITPPIEEDCYFPPGDYYMNNFQPRMDDIDVRVYYYGLLKKRSRFFKDGNMIFCLMSEEIVQP
ncbi:hypothetical protein FQR65_LT07231 [Abscondita terminalis]|nr:hypothetical protein FQR65_LT07231 [Abscondita terminalis]